MSANNTCGAAMLKVLKWGSCMLWFPVNKDIFRSHPVCIWINVKEKRINSKMSLRVWVFSDKKPIIGATQNNKAPKNWSNAKIPQKGLKGVIEVCRLHCAMVSFMCSGEIAFKITAMTFYMQFCYVKYVRYICIEGAYNWKLWLLIEF